MAAVLQSALQTALIAAKLAEYASGRDMVALARAMPALKSVLKHSTEIYIDDAFDLPFDVSRIRKAHCNISNLDKLKLVHAAPLEEFVFYYAGDHDLDTALNFLENKPVHTVQLYNLDSEVSVNAAWLKNPHIKKLAMVRVYTTNNNWQRKSAVEDYTTSCDVARMPRLKKWTIYDPVIPNHESFWNYIHEMIPETAMQLERIENVTIVYNDHRFQTKNLAATFTHSDIQYIVIEEEAYLARQ